MVNKLISIILIAFLTVYTMTSNANNDSKIFKLITKSHSVQYGKTFELLLQIDSSTDINIKELLKPITSIVAYEVTQETTYKNYTEYKLKAHPLSRNKIVLPSLKWQSQKTQPIEIKVSPATSKDRAPIRIEIMRVNHSPWEREQVSVLIKITTTDTNIILNANNIAHSGVESYRLNHSIKKLTLNGQTHYEHTIGWSLFYLYQQKTSITLPQIEYVKDGVPLYKFNNKPLDFKVKKLPIYVSPTTVVGNLNIRTQYIDIPQTFMQPNSSAVILYEISSTTVPAKWLPSISQHYNRIQAKSINFSHINTTVKTSVLANSIISNKSVNIAFSPSSSGRANIQDINIRYFDTNEGRLRNITIKHKHIIVLNVLFKLVLYSLFFYGIYSSFISFIRTIKQLYKKCKFYRLSYKSILNAQTTLDLKNGLRYISLAEGWFENITTNHWLTLFHNRYKASKQLERCFMDLNCFMYSSKNNISEFDTIRNTIYKEVKTRKKR